MWANVAACVAGVYSLAEGLKLIAGRGRLMAGVQGRGAMAAVGAAEERVREALRGFEGRVGIASLTGPESVVISGYEAELGRVEQRLKEWGVGVHRLKVSHGFHSPQMREMEEAFEALAGGVELAAPRLPIISSVTGRGVDREELRQARYWRRQVSEPVRFRQAMESLREQGSEVFLEVGPGTTLGVLGRQSIERSGQMWLASLRRGRGEWEQMLESLGRLYVRGAEVNWAGFDQPYARRRVPLPTYPFQRQRYWIGARPSQRSGNLPAATTEQTQSQPAAVQSSNNLDAAAPDGWFYRVAWKEHDFSLPAKDVSRRHWILLPDRGGVAHALAGFIQSTGSACTLAEDQLALARMLNRSDAPATGIVDLRCLGASDGEAEEPCLALANLVQEIARVDRSGITLWSVTCGAQVTGHETAPVPPWQAPVWALARTILSEHTELWGGMVDLDPAANAENNAKLLWRHLSSFEGEDQAAFRNGSRLVPRLERYAAPPAKNLEFHSDAAYLITGGYGGLGLELARWMARNGAKRIILLGRTALPPRGEWNRLPSEDPRGKAISTIHELESLGVTVQQAAADVGDAEALQRFFESYEREGGPRIRGVVHAAGVARHVLVAHTAADDFRYSFRAKVRGTWLLHQALKGTALDFFVLFSSASAVLSSPRLGPYAASNAFLDAIAEYLCRKGLPALSVNWGVWTDVGMASQPGGSSARALAENGMAGMTTEEGFSCLGRLLGGRGGQVCVLPVDWQKWAKLYPAYMAKPFFSGLISEGLNGSILTKSSAPRVLLDQLKDAFESSRPGILREFVHQVAVRVLGFPASRRIDPLQPLNELGLDSLMALELRNTLSAETAQSLPATLLFNYPTVEDIAAYLEGVLLESPLTRGAVGKLSENNPAPLDRIEELSDEEVDRMLAEKLRIGQ